jgi:hypothetical protein
MSWAEWKLQQYSQGKKANWLERHCLDHANPVHFALQIVGAVPFIWGLWVHNGGLILLGLFLHVIGHIYCRLIKQKEN